jgi:YVTN family beta-propeller protein
MRNFLQPKALISFAGALLLAACSPPPSNPDATPDVADTGVTTDTGVPSDIGETDTGIGMDVVATDTPQPVDTGVDSGPPATARTLPTNGSAIVLTSDDQHAVAVNRTSHSVSVFRTDFAANPPTASRVALLPAAMVGADSEPWAAVIGNDNDTAYVILRRAQQVIKITGVRGTPTIAAARATVGSEPTGIAISPTGRSLYVANYNDGTVTVVNTADMTVTRRVDLNPALAMSGLLGPSVMARPRPALAHPRAIVVTNNGDGNDDDETVYVSEFFAQARTAGLPAGDAQYDVNKQGVVYRFNAGTGAVGALITLAPVDNTGFQDTANNMTGCFPNQLYSMALNSNRLYVTSVCESPRGPTGPVGTAPMIDGRNFQTQIHAVVNVVDTSTNAEVVGQKVNLNQRLQAQYTARMTPDDGTRRMPLIMNDIQFVNGTNVGYVSAYGSDAVFRVRFNADGSFNEVGTMAQNFINLAPATGAPAGRLPVGLALASTAAHATNRALAINENTRNVTVLNLAEQSAASAAASDNPPAAGAETNVNLGRRFFVTGLGRWSLRGQGWNSCEACHPDGLSDNVTWFFARGPRQTTSLDASFNRGGAEQRVFNWTGIFDETHDFELNTRGNSGGLGAIVHRVGMPTSADDRIIFDNTATTGAQIATATPQAGLNGSTKLIRAGVPAMPMGTVTNALADWDEIDDYVKTIRPPRRPSNLDAAAVTAGRALFETHNCAGCHGGPLWTTARRFWTPGPVTNGAMGTLRTMTYMGFAGGFAALNPPSATAAAPLRFTNADAAQVAANDQINCVIRNVGTIGAPAMMGGVPVGVAPAGVVVNEVRANMTTPAQGLTGFSPPGLVGMGLGAPYFHAGNARTLEELFATVFQSHYQAFSANFLTNAATRDQDVANMVQFVLSIDDDTMIVPVRGMLSFNPQLCPATL